MSVQTEVKRRKFIWLGEAVRVLLLYHDATRDDHCQSGTVTGSLVEKDVERKDGCTYYRQSGQGRG